MLVQVRVKLAFLAMLKLDLKWTLLIGTIVRVVLMPFTAHPFDVSSWYKISAGVLSHGVDVNGVLGSVRSLWELTLVPVAYSYGFLSPILGSRAISVSALSYQLNPQYGVSIIPDPLFCFLVKIPMLIADVGITLVLYKMCTHFLGKETAGKAALLFYLNPFSIWISGAWGQMDALPTFFTIFSMYLLLKGKMVFSGFSLLVATLFKVFPAVFLVPASIYLLRKSSKERLLKYYSGFFVPFLMFLTVGLVISGTGLVTDFAGLISGMVSGKTLVGVFGWGLTYWSVSLLYPLDATVWMPVVCVLMAILGSVSVYHVLRMRFIAPLKDLAACTFLLAAAFLLSFPIVPENRFLWLMPFLTLMVVAGLVSWKAYGLVSVLSFVYVQKNFPYYLLPVATINQDILKPLFSFAAPFGRVVGSALLPAPASAAVLAVLGTAFSVVLLVMYVRIIREDKMTTNNQCLYSFRRVFEMCRKMYRQK